MKRIGVLILFFLVFLNVNQGLAIPEPIAAEQIKDLYSNAHIFDCREFKSSYDEGHVKGAIYFDVKQWSNNKALYVNQHLSGIHKENLIFYSSEDRMIKSGKEFNYTGYYASDVATFIEAIPFYANFTFYRVSEDIVPWLEMNSDWSETTNNPPPVGTMTQNLPPTEAQGAMMTMLIGALILISLSVGIYYVKGKMPSKALDQEKALERRKEILSEMSESLKDRPKEKKEFKLQRRRR